MLLDQRWRGHRDQRELANRARDDRRVWERADAHGDVDRSGDEIFDAVAQRELDGHLGVLGPKGHEGGDEHVTTERGGARDPHGASEPAVLLARRVEGIAHCPDRPRAAADEGEGGVREDHPSCRASREARAQPGLQLRDRAAHRGAGHAEAPRSCSEAALVVHREQHLDGPEIVRFHCQSWLTSLVLYCHILFATWRATFRGRNEEGGRT